MYKFLKITDVKLQIIMNAAIILSGGMGTRVGANIPKQYIEIGGKSILEYSLENFFSSKNINILVIVVSPEWRDYVMNFAPKGNFKNKTILYAEPGYTRQLSILNGLNVLEESGYDVNKVIVHDGARPLVSLELIDQCLDACNGHFQGVMPVLPVKDTVYMSKDGLVIDTLLDRNTLYAGQAPEAFMFQPYYKAHQELSYDELLRINGSSELAFLNGLNIKLIQGDPNNYKITDSSDLDRFKVNHQ